MFQKINNEGINNISKVEPFIFKFPNIGIIVFWRANNINLYIYFKSLTLKIMNIIIR